MSRAVWRGVLLVGAVVVALVAGLFVWACCRLVAEDDDWGDE